MSFFEELKRRNVYRVGIAYVVLAWVVIEVTGTVGPALNLPDWTLAIVTWLGIIGLPFALLLAWAFELTPQGILREKEVDRSQSITHSTGRKLDFTIIGLLAVALVTVIIDQYVLEDNAAREATVDRQLASSSNQNIIGPTPAPEQAAAEEAKSIAVLPFVNMSADPEQEYFSDGIAEEILNGLAQVQDLRVAARTSAFSFKGKNIDIRQVGEALSVNHVLEGSVRKAGDRLRITAQLISVNDGYHLWSETYDRKIDDIFAIQDEIARAVVGALEVTLGLSEDAALVRQGTTNTEAYNWFLRGNFYIEGQTINGFDKAIESYSKAAETDPNFAGGHGGLAYGLAYASVFYPYSRVVEQVQFSYKRALAIDEYQPQALLAQAVDAVLSEYNFAVAEQAIEKALGSGVNYSLIVDGYWWLILGPQRRFDKALELLAVAEANDPLSALVKQGIGINLYWKGDHQASVPYLEAALELNPTDWLAPYFLSSAFVKLGELDKAEVTLRRWDEGVLGGDKIWSLGGWAALAVAREDRNGAKQVLEEMQLLFESADNSPTNALHIGLVYALLGDIEEAITWFERSDETPSPFSNSIATWLYHSPAVWNHPRMQALMEKMNLDDVSVAEATAANSTRN
jgi:TolB-like protein